MYSALIPDEGALVYGAKHFGFEFLSRDPSGVYISVFGKKVRVEVLGTFDFDSTRKRSSVVCRMSCDPREISPTDKNEAVAQSKERIVLYCKGADTVIQERLANSEKGAKIAKTWDAMSDMAVDGLRTLCIAYRDLDKNWFESWYQRFEAAQFSLQDRQTKIDDACAEVECELLMLGCTGIEDKLQDGVGDTIENLAQAGIKIWMLTGDKLETAINIGVATSLLGSDAIRITFDFDELDCQREKVAQRLHAEVEHLNRYLTEKSGSHRSFQPNQPKEKLLNDDGSPLLPELSLVMDGNCLYEALQPENQMAFVELCSYCSAVICCRVSPEQKGSVVELIRKSQSGGTLAIGDGANDCNMIRKAAVGVGIRGQEGLQAFNTSDYGISQFRFLSDLTLVHGRWCYRRMAKLVLYMFYKNIVLVLPQFYFAFVSRFSGQKLYFEYMYHIYNVVFTAIPIMIFGVLDQDVTRALSLRYPSLYKLGNEDFHFSLMSVSAMVLNGIWHSLVVFIIPFFAYGGTSITHWDGKPSDIWLTGSMIYLVLVLVVNLKVLLETYYMTWLTYLGLLLSILAWFILMLALFTPAFAVTLKMSSELLGVTSRMFQQGPSWAVIFVTVTLCLCRDVWWKAFRRTFMPAVYHFVQNNDPKVLNAARKMRVLMPTLRKDSQFRPLSYTENDRGEDPRTLGRRATRGFAYTEPDPLQSQLVAQMTMQSMNSMPMNSKSKPPLPSINAPEPSSYRPKIL
eukprot:Platyproteum_vivax@DN2402_c0_g2_i1.p1